MAHAGADEIKLVSHSNVVYWWPAWVVGYVMAFLSYVQGSAVTIEPDAVAYIHPSNNPGLLFIATLVLLVIFTNAKLRGIYSVVTIVTAAFFAVLLAWLGWWDDILAFLPQSVGPCEHGLLSAVRDCLSGRLARRLLGIRSADLLAGPAGADHRAAADRWRRAQL